MSDSSKNRKTGSAFEDEEIKAEDVSSEEEDAARLTADTGTDGTGTGMSLGDSTIETIEEEVDGSDEDGSEGGTDEDGSGGGTDEDGSEGGTDEERSGGGTDEDGSQGVTDDDGSEGGTDENGSEGGTDEGGSQGGTDEERSQSSGGSSSEDKTTPKVANSHRNSMGSQRSSLGDSVRSAVMSMFSPSSKTNIPPENAQDSPLPTRRTNESPSAQSSQGRAKKPVTRTKKSPSVKSSQGETKRPVTRNAKKSSSVQSSRGEAKKAATPVEEDKKVRRSSRRKKT